jgi:hypothetical protein
MQEMAGMCPDKAASGADKQIAIKAVANTQPFVTWKSIPCGVCVGCSWPQRDKSAVVIANPHLTLHVLMNHSGMIAGQTFRAAVHQEGIIPQTSQGAIHADPKIPLAIFK